MTKSNNDDIDDEILIPLDRTQRRLKDSDLEQAKLVYNTIEKCRRDTEYVLEHDLRTRKLLQAVQQHCDSRVLSEGILLKKCTNEDFNEFSIRGEMSEPQKRIKLCCNRLAGIPELRRTLIHELVHSFDHCRLRKTRHVGCNFIACTEIRAYALGGQCDLPVDLAKFDGNRDECIKYWATMSTIRNCDNGVEAVERMFEKCHKDLSPFNLEEKH
ncbi:hypothetical protein C9374_007497 [Naegleria lovaniensis]|uniref:Mitochondrial inner membrane protease ATP23 n=1 Tax=Naegleria lovaniensis TaxID=51637 RepID=A0AA88GN56_NAELO|nr:uncharacterized protein C9374_007497 [Naegleria lovaniensis]KAG2379358.1 hypothetical protein C9374_007497 [Naegleria lovaniensis]